MHPGIMVHNAVLKSSCYRLHYLFPWAKLQMVKLR